MPNLIVYVDLRAAEPTSPSLFALGEARRVARHLGASVYALVTAGDLPPARLEDLAALLGVAGADKVLVCLAPALQGPALDATHGRALAAAAERIPPALFLFPAGAAGAELGPRLAARLGAAYAPSADLVLEPAGLRILRWRGCRDAMRRLDPGEMERPVVATLGAARPPRGLGTRAVEVQVVAVAAGEDLVEGGAARDAAITELSAEPDDAADVEVSHGLLLCASDLGEAAIAALRAAAPPGVAVAVLGQTPAAAVDAACPAFVLGIGVPAPPVGSPATRQGQVLPSVGAAPPAAGVDAVWNTDPASALADITEALRRLDHPR